MMTKDELDSHRWTVVSVNLSLCQTMCFYSGQTDRKASGQAAAGRGRGRGGKTLLHCTQESTCSALWECLDISSNGSAWEKKGKVVLYALTAAGWREGAGPNLT